MREYHVRICEDSGEIPRVHSAIASFEPCGGDFRLFSRTPTFACAALSDATGRFWLQKSVEDCVLVIPSLWAIRDGSGTYGAAQARAGELFYSFRLDDAVPEDHAVRELAAVLICRGCMPSWRAITPGSAALD